MFLVCYTTQLHLLFTGSLQTSPLPCIAAWLALSSVRSQELWLVMFFTLFMEKDEPSCHTAREKVRYQLSVMLHFIVCWEYTDYCTMHRAHLKQRHNYKFINILNKTPEFATINNSSEANWTSNWTPCVMSYRNAESSQLLHPFAVCIERRREIDFLSIGEIFFSFPFVVSFETEVRHPWSSTAINSGARNFWAVELLSQLNFRPWSK